MFSETGVEEVRAPRVARHDGRGRRASNEMADMVDPLAPPKVAHQHGGPYWERRARGLRRGHLKSQLLVRRVEKEGRLLDLHAPEVEVAEGEAETVVLRAFIFIGIITTVLLINFLFLDYWVVSRCAGPLCAGHPRRPSTFCCRRGPWPSKPTGAAMAASHPVWGRAPAC